MTTTSIDDIFLIGNIKKLESENSELNNKKLEQEYTMYTTYDWELHILIEKIKKYFTMEVPNRAA